MSNGDSTPSGNMSYAKGNVPDTLAEFFQTLGQDQATSSGTPVVAAPPTPPPTMPTSPSGGAATPSAPTVEAPATPAPVTPTPVAAPAAAPSPTPGTPPRQGTTPPPPSTFDPFAQFNEHPDAALTEALKGQIDPELLDTLRNQAKGKVTLGEVIALAGLAAANPELANEVIRQREQYTTNARSILANLQQQALNYRHIQAQMAYYQSRAQEMERRALITGNLRLISRAQEDVGGQAIPAFTGDPANEAEVGEYISSIQPLRKAEQGRKDKAGALNQVTNNVLAYLKMGAIDPAHASDIATNQLTSTGFFTEEEARQAMAANPAVASAAKMHAQNLAERNTLLQRQQEEATARTGYLNQQSQRIKDAIAKGDLSSLHQLVTLSSGLTQEQARIDADLARVNQERFAWTGLPDDDPRKGSDMQFQELRRLELQRSTLQQQRDMVNQSMAESAIALNAQKDRLFFSDNYKKMFSDASDRIVATDPAVQGNPTTFAQLIAQPGMNPTKERFWTALMADVRAKYGKLSREEVVNLLEQEAATKAHLTNANSILTQQQQAQMWSAAQPAAAPPQKEEAPANIPQGGLMETIKGLLGGTTGKPLLSTPEEGG